MPSQLVALSTEFPDLTIIHLPRATSTNDVAARLAREGAGDLTLVTADVQTAGRGRRGRTWLAPPRKALLCSLVLRPHIPPSQAQRLTMLAAVAAARAIQGLGATARLKWPNDIMIGGAKVGGILAEAQSEGEHLAYIVLGIGINVNLAQADLDRIPGHATSLNLATGRRGTRWRLLRLLLAEFIVHYRAVTQDGGQAVFEEWRASLQTLGREVTVDSGGVILHGHAEDVDPNGALLLRLAGGRLERVTFGDVS